jgi:NAD(P)-dependent dehydrogenase (short-subunit alcohol dehydrogenase family)
VKRFAAEGAKVVIAQRDLPSGKAAQREVETAGGTALFVPTDVARRSDLERLVEQAVSRFARIDVLVNNAAILGGSGPFLEVTQEAWDSMIATNLTAVFVCSQLAARVMARAGGGTIISISSSNAHVPQPTCAPYAAAKGGLEVLSRGMAVDLAPYHIRVNVIAPGPIQSRAPDDAPPRPIRATLMGRCGLPGEVASAALFLASDQSSYITGQTLCVDGGLLVDAYNLYGGPRPKAIAGAQD